LGKLYPFAFLVSTPCVVIGIIFVIIIISKEHLLVNIVANFYFSSYNIVTLFLTLSKLTSFKLLMSMW